MQETGKHDGQQGGTGFLYRLLLWLAVVFSLGDTPFGRGELLADPESRSARLSRVLQTAPSRHHVVPTHIFTDTQLGAPSRITVKAYATENTEPASALPSRPATADENDRLAKSVIPTGVLRRMPSVGFSSRAPPSLA